MSGIRYKTRQEAKEARVRKKALSRADTVARYGKDYFKSINMKNTYGITLEQRNAIISDQNGKCACCGELLALIGKNGANIDHCHRTGKVRGILCGGCNRGLGQFKDSADRCEQAASYLRKYNAQS